MPELELMAILGSLTATLATLASIAFWLGRRFEAIDRQFQAINKQFEAIDEQFQAIDKRFEGFQANLKLAIEGLRGATVSINSMLVEFIGIKGLITRQEVKFLTAEAQRLASAVTYLNPLKKQDAEFLKEVFSSGDPERITIEQAERVAEIGKRWWLEEGDEKAYRLFLIGTFIKAYHLHKVYGAAKTGLAYYYSL